MAKNKLHIGKEIERVFRKSGMTVTKFSELINLSRNVTYDVFKREHINTGQLLEISRVLKHNFFVYYISEI